MCEVRPFPGVARVGAVNSIAESAFRLSPSAGDHAVAEAVGHHASELRTFGAAEQDIAADAAGFRRAIEDQRTELHAEAVRADPEERTAARDIVGALFERMRG